MKRTALAATLLVVAFAVAVTTNEFGTKNPYQVTDPLPTETAEAES